MPRHLKGLSFSLVLLLSGPALAGGYPRIDLYVTHWCPHCRRATEYLQEKGIPFVTHDIEADPQAAARHRQLAPDAGVPVAHIGDQVVRGFSKGSYERALRQEGALLEEGEKPETGFERAPPDDTKPASKPEADPWQRRWIRSY